LQQGLHCLGNKVRFEKETLNKVTRRLNFIIACTEQIPLVYCTKEIGDKP